MKFLGITLALVPALCSASSPVAAFNERAELAKRAACNTASIIAGFNRISSSYTSIFNDLREKNPNGCGTDINLTKLVSDLSAVRSRISSEYTYLASCSPGVGSCTSLAPQAGRVDAGVFSFAAGVRQASSALQCASYLNLIKTQASFQQVIISRYSTALLSKIPTTQACSTTVRAGVTSASSLLQGIRDL